MLPATATKGVPWYIIPADHKWLRNYWVSHVLAATMGEMDQRAPLLADKSLVTKRFK